MPKEYFKEIADEFRSDESALQKILLSEFSNEQSNTYISRDYENAAYDMNSEMQLIDARYRAESALLDAISNGCRDAAFQALTDYGTLMSSPSQRALPTSSDSLRDFKNSVHTMNTLFRKAIELNHVHPIYIHESSSDFGLRIEQSETIQSLSLLIGEMINRYCYLVQKYSVKAYSETVRKAILFIDLNLATNISTKDVAGDQFLSPNYLSTRFRKETGKTISNFILEKRIKMACEFLKTSDTSIHDIAFAVGFDDFSYFSKQFKRIKGVSPLKYKNQIFH